MELTIIYGLASMVGGLGRWDESIQLAKKAIRLHPFAPAHYFQGLGRAYFMTGQYDEAITTLKKGLKRNPNYLPAQAFLAACYTSLNRHTEAAAAADEVLRINPKFTLESYAKTLPYKNEADKERYISALRNAGLPENPSLPLPDKPSIAVLPFKDLSGESKQEYLADGITESIIGTISRASGLFVIASNSVFTYKGKAVKVQTVSKELGVKYVLEGTVQKAGNQLRVNAQLIDAITGQHLWSKKYDQHTKDLFSVQDHISKEILTALRVKFFEGEQERVWARGTDDLEAYLKYLKAYDTFKSFNRQNMILTRQTCEEAIALDSTCEPAYSLIGVSYLIDLWFGWAESPRSAIENSERALKKSISLNPQSDFAYANLGHLYLMQKRHDEALVAGKKSVDLNPNGDYNMVLLAMTLMYSGRSEEAIPLYKDAWRRNPYCPAWYIHAAGVAYRNMGKWDEAIAAAKKALDRKPDHFPALLVMASVYGMSGQLEEGRAVTAKIMKINPGYCEKKQRYPYLNEADTEAAFNGYRIVGIPECPTE